MFFVGLLFITALSITCIAGYFAILGLMAIFPAAPAAVAAMGGVFELSKLVTASWVYRNWSNANKLLKTYFTSAVIILSFITSMGVFGYLSKAHLEHSVSSGDNTIKIERLDAKIEQETRQIDAAERQLTQLDAALDRYIELGSVSRGLSARQSQEAERSQLNAIITSSQETRDSYADEKTALQTTQLGIEAEIGPIKYVAELFYGDGEKDTIDKAVRMMILILITVMDPLAILLVIAANISIKQLTSRKESDSVNEVSVKEDENFTDTIDRVETPVSKPPVQVKKKLREIVVDDESGKMNMEKHGSTHAVPAPDPPRIPPKIMVDKNNIRRM